ncbi:hypothetical protein I5L01_16010, partial [Erythrobacter sp. YJ-T3-07]|uniref:hypothetical protein n=1 Tax=Erythrobacter sp. YJ-T3-07 TaxID=2793063 RepID=UPI0018D48B8A
LLERLAEALRQRGLVEVDKVKPWPSDKLAAESLGVPEQFLEALWKAGYVVAPTSSCRKCLISYRDNLTTTRAQNIGWQPKWDKKKFLDNIDDEIDAVLEHEKAKSSLIDSLFAAARAGQQE